MGGIVTGSRFHGCSGNFAELALIRYLFVIGISFVALFPAALAASTNPYPPEYYREFLKGNPLFDLTGVDEKPQIVGQRPQDLPDNLKALKVKATVVVEVTVVKDGTPKYVIVVESSDKRFDDFAVTLAKNLKFKPGIKKGKPANCRFRLPLSFG